LVLRFSLGPEFVAEALAPISPISRNSHFIDNTDPAGIDHQRGYSLASTLALVILQPAKRQNQWSA